MLSLSDNHLVFFMYPSYTPSFFLHNIILPITAFQERANINHNFTTILQLKNIPLILFHVSMYVQVDPPCTVCSAGKFLVCIETEIKNWNKLVKSITVVCNTCLTGANPDRPSLQHKSPFPVVRTYVNMSQKWDVSESSHRKWYTGLGLVKPMSNDSTIHQSLTQLWHWLLRN